MRCLVTGATGYVGGRLVPRLLSDGYQVRCLTRSRARLRKATWADQVEAAEGDVVSGDGLADALRDVDVGYYLVHSIGQADFEAKDRTGAQRFAEAADRAGVRRLVYLGGPRPDAGSQHTSAHLRSRAEVADILEAARTPATVLRAAVIIGSGSASFEMLRYLTERLPVMVTPRWVGNRIEPIAVGDVLRYLTACADPSTFPPELNRAFDIGCGQVVTFAEMMRRYARIAHLPRRMIIPVRPLTPQLSSLWVGLVTPVPQAIARPLVASLIHEAVTTEHDIADYVPDPPAGLTDVDTAIRLALRRTRESAVPTRWSDAAWPGAPQQPLPADPLPADPLPTDPQWSGGTVYTDVRVRDVQAPGERLWRLIESIGGEQGWYSFGWAWSLRGFADRLLGGVGLRRGRRDPRRLAPGDVVDFWRVEEIVPGTLLRLRAEMRLPGRAWLEMRITPDGAGHCQYEQRAVFLPKGLAGTAYWTAMAPFHDVVFGGMARNLARRAESS